MARFLRAVSFLAYVLIILSPAFAHARDPAAPPEALIDFLDGQTFFGRFVPVGKSSGRADEFVFKNGKFHSRECLAWGFVPGPYWVRTENGHFYFLARLTSKENGVMTYQGLVSDKKIDATIEWVKPRWYWTMKRNFRFRGTISGVGKKRRK